MIYRAEIVDTPDFNAFAVPGGFVYIHRGLLERVNSMDELASVIGHEIAHIAARHSAAQISKAQLLNIGLLGATIATKGAVQDYGNLIDLGSILAFSKFSRDDERQADKYGIRYMTKAGYNPGASIDVMEQIQIINDSEPGALEIWFMTHPPTSERIDLLKQELNRIRSEQSDVLKRYIRRNEFIELLEGMAVGEWNGKEFVKDDRYFNKEYLLNLPVPDGWQVQINNDDYTAAFYDDKDESFAYFHVQALRERKTSEDFFNELSEILIKQGLKKEDKGALKTKHFSHGAIAGTFRGDSSGSGPVRAGLIAFTREGTGYYIFGIGKEETFHDLQPLLESMINGLRFMSAREASEMGPPRMRIHRVAGGETWDSITNQYYNTQDGKTGLAEYNGLGVDNDPAQGTLLKIPPSLSYIY